MIVPECVHIKTDGIRCGSPALRGGYRCYHHAAPSRLRARRATRFTVPEITDPVSLQAALSLIIGALANGELEARRASALLYAVQLAHANFNRM